MWCQNRPCFRRAFFGLVLLNSVQYLIEKNAHLSHLPPPFFNYFLNKPFKSSKASNS
jgi:hypothetical protein